MSLRVLSREERVVESGKWSWSWPYVPSPQSRSRPCEEWNHSAVRFKLWGEECGEGGEGEGGEGVEGELLL
jgi:hypothetical protein